MIKKLLLAISALTLLNSCYYLNLNPDFSDKTPAEIAYKYNQMGVEKLNNKQIPEAIGLFSKAIENGGNRVYIYYFNRGVAFAQQNKHEQSIADYKEALKVQPQSVPILYNLAIAYSYLNQVDDAINSSSKAILANPAYAPAYGNLSWNYLFKKNYRMSLYKAIQALQINPKMYWVYTNLGHAYLFLDQYKLALQAYQASQMPQVVLDDYKELKQAGIYHRDMSRVESVFKELLKP